MDAAANTTDDCSVLEIISSSSWLSGWRDRPCKHLFDPSVESGDAPFQHLDQAEVMVDKESMMRRHATVERSGKVRSGTLQTGRSEFAQPRRVRLARNHRFQNAPPAHAHNVRDRRHEL